ncbi:MAG: M17 family metallopeptidase [Proteobacteria bacterium]|nr:M17 family metallopeptidase [Pseudomonadota bacterium]
MLNRKIVANKYPQEEHSEDTLLLVLNSPGAVISPWIAELKKNAIPALQRDVHHAKLSIGLKDPRRPYVIVEWPQIDRHKLERRWILSQFYRSLRQQWRVKKICIVLAESPHAITELGLAEDAWLSAMQPNDKGNNWETCEILSVQAEPLNSFDPHAAVRWDGLLGYHKWINENPDELTSIEMGVRLQRFAAENGCDFRELGIEELKREGLNLLLAVGQGARLSPSRLFIVTRNLSQNSKPLMLIGKGVTFDSGGINLKSFEGHVNAMKNDMGGAALTAHVFQALVRSGYAGPLVLVIPACENSIDANSMKPGVLVKSHKGLDVFIEHTDAEGRLILADALSFAHSLYKPGLTVMAATLTTASLRQFSNYFTGVHFASEKFQKLLHSKGDKWGERFSCWDEFLPFKNANATKAADLTNMGRLHSHANIGGGSNVAAHFLKEFAKYPLVHFDIFCSCWNWSGDYPGSAFGATGAPFNTMFDMLRAHGPELSEN